MLTTEEIIKEIVDSKALDIYENVGATTVNEEELSKTGTVTVDIETTDDTVTKTFLYKSFDGKVEFKKTHYYPVELEFENKIQELTDKITLATNKQDYENAHKYKTIKDELLNNSLL